MVILNHPALPDGMLLRLRTGSAKDLKVLFMATLTWPGRYARSARNKDEILPSLRFFRMTGMGILPPDPSILRSFFRGIHVL